jgi:hypothetical protein
MPSRQSSGRSRQDGWAWCSRSNCLGAEEGETRTTRAVLPPQVERIPSHRQRRDVNERSLPARHAPTVTRR